MTALEPDRDQIEIFVDALFRHAPENTYVSLRAFGHDNSVFRITPDSAQWERAQVSLRRGRR